MSPAWRMPSNSTNTFYPAASAGSLKCFRYQLNPLLRAPIAAAMVDDHAERVGIVERLRRADGLSHRIVERHLLGAGHGLADELPARIEVVSRARRRGWRESRLRRPKRTNGDESGECHQRQEIVRLNPYLKQTRFPSVFAQDLVHRPWTLAASRAQRL